MAKSAHGTGCLIKRGDRWASRILIKGEIIQRVIIDPNTGEHQKTKSQVPIPAMFNFSFGDL